MSVAGPALVAVEIVRSFPAWRRVRAAKSVDGYSAVYLGINLGTIPSWIVLTVLAEAPWVLFANALWGTFAALLTYEALKLERPMGLKALRVAAATLMFSALVMGLSLPYEQLEVSSGLLVGLATVIYGPHALWVGLTATTTRGLSVVSLAVNCAEGTIYLFAGLGFGLIAPEGELVLGFIISGILSILCNAPRLIRTSWRRIKGLDSQVAALDTPHLDLL